MIIQIRLLCCKRNANKRPFYGPTSISSSCCGLIILTFIAKAIIKAVRNHSSICNIHPTYIDNCSKIIIRTYIVALPERSYRTFPHKDIWYLLVDRVLVDRPQIQYIGRRIVVWAQAKTSPSFWNNKGTHLSPAIMSDDGEANNMCGACQLFSK